MGSSAGDGLGIGRITSILTVGGGGVLVALVGTGTGLALEEAALLDGAAGGGACRGANARLGTSTRVEARVVVLLLLGAAGGAIR